MVRGSVSNAGVRSAAGRDRRGDLPTAAGALRRDELDESPCLTWHVEFNRGLLPLLNLQGPPIEIAETEFVCQILDTSARAENRS